MKNTSKILFSVLLVLLLCITVVACGHDADEHVAAGEWQTDATHHWKGCEDECEGAEVDKAEHTFDNACDTTCDVCGYTRTVGAHVYDNACDTKCNVCEAERTITHAHGTTLTVGDTTHYYLCSVCGDKKDEVAHSFDKTVAHSDYLKAAATATTKAQYWKSCVCGKASATEYFETDKTAATLSGIQDLSKTYDKVALANPTYTTNSDGAVTFEWYKGDTKLDAKPVNAGTYKVKVIIPETATYAGVSAEKEFTIATKTLSNLTVDLTYNGTAYFEVPLGAANGIVSGDVADGIKVCITFASKNVGASVTGAGLDAEDGDGYTNYELDLTTCTASIVPKVLNDVTYNFTYNDNDYQQVVLTSANHSGIIGSDQVFLEVCFVDTVVDSDVDTTAGSAPAFNDDNYTLGTYSFAIVPKKLTLKAGEKIERIITYNGQKNHTLSVSSDSFDGYVDADAASLWLTATTPSKNVGQYTDGVILTPYVGNSAFGTVSHNYDFSEVAATIKVNKMIVNVSGVTAEYNGTTQFTFDEPLRLTSAHTSGQDYILSADEVYLNSFKLSAPDASSEEFVNYGDYTLSGADVGNYDIDEFAVEITKKKLTNLQIDVTEAVYDVPGTDGSETATLTLLVKDGIIPGEIVQITVTNYAEMDLWNGTFELCLKNETEITQGQEIIALVASGDYANYELVADANGVVGILNIVANCDVQYNGTCNCGNSHVTSTFRSVDTVATVPVGPAGGTTWEGGIYALNTTNSGYWNIKPNGNYCTITVYDSEGNTVTVKGFEFYANKGGTYYVHIGKNSTTASGDAITFRYAEELVDVSSNQSGYYESDYVDGVATGEYWFKINPDTQWGQSLAILDENEQELDPTKYTVKAYDANFNLLEDVVYEDQEDIYRTGGESLYGKDIYIAVVLNEDLEFYIAVY